MVDEGGCVEAEVPWPCARKVVETRVGGVGHDLGQVVEMRESEETT